MREDFNKLLTERERFGHKSKFRPFRHKKVHAANEEFSAGREGMKERHNTKSFNENLNPLRSFIHSNVGRPWDKVYSEICKNFDKRKVINAHILEHLFQYVELEIYIIDGKPHTMHKYRHRNNASAFEPIAGQRYVEWYVDPRDGILKYNKNRQTKAEQSRKSAAETAEKQKAMYRKIDDDNHLILKDGIWWHYQCKAKPAQVAEYDMPENFALTLPANTSAYSVSRAWEALPTTEKEKVGKKTMVDAPLRDKLDTPEVPGFSSFNYYRRYSHVASNTLIPSTKYFFSKTTASHKQLKAAGVDGMIPKEDVARLSHREASKYRSKGAKA